MIIGWFKEVVHHFQQSALESGLKYITEDFVRERFKRDKSRNRIYSVWVVFQMFLSQRMSGCSCRQAVERAVCQGWIPATASVQTAGYCQARQRLAEAPLKEVCLGYGRHEETRLEAPSLWCGRRVKVVDGTGFQLPDTAANQRAYPQPPSQKEGLGFPVLYVCALMSLATGCILEVEEGRGPGFERPLFRRLWHSLEAGDVIVGDAGFGSYAEMALLHAQGVDTVCRERHRKFQLRDAVKNGAQDWTVSLKKPRHPGAWTEGLPLPETLQVRVIEFTHAVNGFRSQKITLVTTLLDPRRYSRQALIALYHQRWLMEVRLRDIKTTMGLETLSAVTPDGCRKDLWMGLLAYNIVRSFMRDASLLHRCPLERLSFAGTLQRLEEFSRSPWSHGDPSVAYQQLLKRIAADVLPHRPYRREPRAVKRRPKQYSLLTLPRKTWKMNLCHA